MKRVCIKYLLLAASLALFVFRNPALVAQIAYPVRITAISFSGGGGIGPTSSGYNHAGDYFRAYGIAGTGCRINAEMLVGGNWQPMYGDTLFTINYSDGTSSGNFNVTILSGQNSGSSAVPYSALGGFDSTWIGEGETRLFSYSIGAVSGEFCSGVISSSVSASIYWDRVCPPSDGLFPPASAESMIINTTASTCKLFWQPLAPSTNASGYMNGDFYEYRVKYRLYSEEGTERWRVWNGTNDPSLRYISNNPVANPGTESSLHFFEGRKYTTLVNLKLFTRYEYYVEAVDVFGNVSAEPAAYFSFSTLPYSTEVKLSDGISVHSDFTDPADARSRTLRDTNIRADLTVVSTDTVPDSVFVWYTAVADTDIVLDGREINSTAFPSGTLYSVEAKPTGPNRWSAYLDSDTNAMANGNTVRMIVETRSGTVSSFSDFDISDLDANDDEWTFYVGTLTKFTPWPARILNNVIDKKNPAAYPAYYLSEDAYVTIMAYDIKGRVVATILEQSFRRGGQNIKEGGWRGTNKTGRKLGVGLYYIKISARSAKTKKIILDRTEKVVIAY